MNAFESQTEQLKRLDKYAEGWKGSIQRSMRNLERIDAAMNSPCGTFSCWRFWRFLAGWGAAFWLLITFFAHWQMGLIDWLIVGLIAIVLAVECTWAHFHEPIPGTVTFGDPPHWSKMRAECRCGATLRKSATHAGWDEVKTSGEVGS